MDFEFTSYTDLLRNTKKHICIYGMGNGAEKIIAYLSSFGIKYSCVFASDGFVRGQMFLGQKVLSLSQAEEMYGDFIAVTAFALEGEKADIFTSLSKRHRLIAPNLPPFGEGCIDNDYLSRNKDKIDAVYSLFADDESRNLFLSLLEYTVTGDIGRLSVISNTPEEWKNGSIFADVGAYNGDTVAEFISDSPDYKEIYAFEPEKNSFSRLLKNTAGVRNLTSVNAAVWESDGKLFFENKKGRGSGVAQKGIEAQCVCLDKYFTGKAPPDRIKIDGEGCDGEILKGCVNMIYNSSPSIKVALYHRAFDLIEIPLWLYRQNPKYRFYLRNKKYIPAFDVFLFALPKK